MAENENKPKGNWKKEGWGKKPDTDTMIVTRIPPQNIDAEKSVLGAMLLDKDAIMTAEDKRRMWPPRRWWTATLTSSQTRRSSGG